MTNLFLIVSLLSLVMGNAWQEDIFPRLSGPYLGQEPPSGTAIKFLPEIFKNIHCSPIFSPDGKQVYWRMMDRKSLVYMEEKENFWSMPRPVPFRMLFYKQDVPFFSADGKRLFFISSKPQQFYKIASDETIWYVEKDGTKWSGPKPLGKELNRVYTHWQFSVAANGNLYFNGSTDPNHDVWFIYKSEYKNGNYLKPEKLLEPECIAKGEPDYLFPFIAPDESYLIFCKTVHGNKDLFISFRGKNNKWTEGINLGEKINSPGIELCPVVSPDGKYLFYMRRDCVMWVQAGFIEKLRPKE